MASFYYKGKKNNGDYAEGYFEAANSDVVAQHLLTLGIYPITIEEKEKTTNSTSKGKAKLDLLLFTRQMYALLKAGVPIAKSLKTLENSSQNEFLKNLYNDISQSLESGYELNIALQKHKKMFSPFYISMVRVGEVTGRLEEVFSKLYDYLEFEQEMKNKAKAALRYPMIITGVMALAFSILSFFVIPAFAKIYENFNAELPLPTRILIGFSDFMINYGAILFLLGGGAIYGFLKYIKTVDGRAWWDKTRLQIPIFGNIVLKSILARFSRAFALSMKSGVPIVQTLSVTSQVLDNVYIGQHIEQIKESIERGNTLYNSMKSTNVFTPLVLEMVATGEETGELDTMLNEVGTLYEREIEYQLKTINTQIEPILLLFLGVLLAILALGIFLPIWDLGKVIK